MMLTSLNEKEPHMYNCILSHHQPGMAELHHADPIQNPQTNWCEMESTGVTVYCIN